MNSNVTTITRNSDNINSVNELTNNHSKFLSKFVIDIESKDFNSITKKINTLQIEYFKIAIILNLCIKKDFTDAAIWILTEYPQLVLIEDIDIVDNAIISSNAIVLAFILETLERYEEKPKIKYSSSLDAIALKQDMKIFNLLKKYDVIMPLKKLYSLIKTYNLQDLKSLFCI